MSDRHHPLRPRQRQIADISPRPLFNRAGLRRTRVNTHPHFEGSWTPGFVLQAALRSQSSLERIAGSMKRRAKGVTRDLKDVSMMRPDGLMQNGMMLRKKDRQIGGELLRQRGAAFDVGKQKRDGAGR